MKYIIVYYRKSKYFGFIKKYILESDKIIELNKIINDKSVIEYYFYDLKTHIERSEDNE